MDTPLKNNNNKEEAQPLASFFVVVVPAIYKKNSQDLEINKSENVNL